MSVADRATGREIGSHETGSGPRPGFLSTVAADARVVSANRGRRLGECSRRRALAEALRLAWTSDAFAAQILYRLRVRLADLGVPVLPRILHRLSILFSQLCIGDPVTIHPGVHLAHGQIVIDGIVEIEPGCVIFPFTTVGLLAGELRGPTIRRRATIGSGARVLGPVEIGSGARVGANAVVLEDVPAGATAVGAPARIVEGSTE